MPFRETVPHFEAALPLPTSRMARLSTFASKWHVPELCTYLLLVIFLTWAEIAITASLYCPDDLWITLLVSCSSKVLMTYLSLHVTIWRFGLGATHRESWTAIRKGYMGNDCITKYVPEGLKIMAIFCCCYFVGALEKLVWSESFSREKRARREAN